jgi:glycosyltransferase involved in cell wall biosynthesis
MVIKKIAIYSNAWDNNAGGGIVYVLAIAKILTLKGYDTTVFFNNSIVMAELQSRYETLGLKIKTFERRPFPLLSQLNFAIKELLNFDIVIQQSLSAPRLTFVKKSFILCDFPMKKMESFSEKIRLMSWNNIIVNSEYTKYWVQQYWNRSSIVLYPPIENILTINHERNKDVVCIGRFNRGKRSKRQEVVLQVFIDIIKTGMLDWKLHLIGYVQDKDYLDSLKKQSEGLPIFFYENCSSEKRMKILNQSAIFISASGFEINEKEEPMLVEHYGISVVEAMACGCVPLVVGKGGHKETVDHEINGYHWSTKEELKKIMITLIKNEALIKELSKKAFVKSLSYSLKALESKLIETVSLNQNK